MIYHFCIIRTFIDCIYSLTPNCKLDITIYYLTLLFIFHIFCIVNKSPEKIKNGMILITSMSCVAKTYYSLFLHAKDLHGCPKTIKNTSVSHTAAQGANVLHNHKHYF